jgi:hypothetical protein
MTAREILLREIVQAPDPLVEEVLDFLCFVKTRHFHPPVADANLNQKRDYEKISRVRGLLCDRQKSFIKYASEVRQEWE